MYGYSPAYEAIDMTDLTDFYNERMQKEKEKKDNDRERANNSTRRAASVYRPGGYRRRDTSVDMEGLNDTVK